MASALPPSGSLSAGTRAGVDRSINAFKNDVITSTSNNSKFSLKESSDAFAAARSNSLVLPQMVAGPPYKFSELYGARKTKHKQIISWSPTVDGSDFYTWSPGVRGIPSGKIGVLLDISHSGDQQRTGMVTGVFTFFRNQPTKIYVQITANQCITQINGVQVLSSGSNASQTVNVAVDVSPTANGSFLYKTGDLTGNLGPGRTVITLAEQLEVSGTLLVTHRNFQYPSSAGITSMLFENDVSVAVHSLIGGKVGLTRLPFNIIEATKASIQWSGRGSVSITEYPNTENGYSTTVLIDDDGRAAAGGYAINLTLEI